MPPVSQAEVSQAEVSTTSGRTAKVGQLSRDDCVCTVCLEIFLEPVTLPCDHTFCKPCFLDTVDKANMCCPLCRKRVSSWARKNSRDKTLVNRELWTRVQAAFPTQCRRRLLGLEEDEEDEELLPMAKVSQPGELRREYEDQISKLAEEKRALEDAERRASEEYIQRLLSEEEERLAEERRRHEERQLEDDELMARLLSEELNQSPISDTQRNPRANEVTPAKKKSKANTGDIEKFLCPVPPKHNTSDSSSSFMANKENILHPAFSPLSPKEPTDRPTPHTDHYGRQSPASHPALSSAAKPDQWPSSPSSSKKHGSSSFQMPPSTKRKSSETEPSGEEEAPAKRPCAPPAAAAAAGRPEEVPLLHELAHQEEEHFSRRQQEQEDRKLALRLQKELDKEERSKATDRSKGSPNSYEFRQNPKPTTRARAKDAASTSAGPEQALTGRPSRAPSSSSSSSPGEEKDKGERGPCGGATVGQKRASTASSPPANPLTRGSKQATLTDMFPSLAS